MYQSELITRILLGVADPSRQRLSNMLAKGGAVPDLARDVEELWEKVTRADYDLLVVARGLVPEPYGAFLRSIEALPDSPAVIVLTDEERPRERAELLSLGCQAVLWLGLDDDVLSTTLLAIARRLGEDVLGRLGAERAEKRSTLDDFVSTSPAMQHFLRVARRVVKSDSPLLILGETGVGKERLARSIHSESRRSGGPFITVNCGALPETLMESELFGHEEGAFTGAIRSRRGFFELAHRGTIFLDEIGEMPLHLQVKLLRVLEDRNIRRVGSERPIQVDVRIMAATNRDVKLEMEQNRFRADLYYRLAVVTLTVPPLRERREDVAVLAQLYLQQIGKQLRRPVSRFHPDALRALVDHDWPGNVRELINVIERAVLLARNEEIRLEDLRGDQRYFISTASNAAASDAAHPPVGLDKPLVEARREVVEAFELGYLRSLLARTRGRIGETARLAGINERTLYDMMRRYDLKKEDFKG